MCGMRHMEEGTGSAVTDRAVRRKQNHRSGRGRGLGVPGLICGRAAYQVDPHWVRERPMERIVRDDLNNC